ncbi:MAG: tetratricopeptide repeat protein [Planctomycetaceae bacterium]
MRRIALIVMLLVFGTLFVYAQTFRFGLITLDDQGYVIDTKQRLTDGLTAENVRWALRTNYFANWHPLTWLSYMLDAEIHGIEPGRVTAGAGGFHLTNVVLHLANVLLLFFILRGLTGADWKSAAVAGLFAVHPIHVESVAWVSGRKDMLFMFFGLLAIGAYAKYVRASERSSRIGAGAWYFAALLAFSASLMSKQTLVTLPFALLLLDFWPLGRTRNAPLSQLTETFPPKPVSWTRLILEKIPFLALAVAASVAVVIAQRASGAIRGLDRYDLPTRLFNAVLAYGLYLKKLIWPLDLAVFYPHPGESISMRAVALAAGALVALTMACFVMRRRQPWLIVGWLWFLGTLVPMIGLVQVGIQQMADRYAYVPAIGAYIAAVWLAGTLLSSLKTSGRDRIAVAVAISVPLCFICVRVAQRQAGHWKDAISLFEHTLSVTDANAMAHSCLATGYRIQATRLERAGHLPEARLMFENAERHYESAIGIDPGLIFPPLNFGRLWLQRGDFAKAVRYLELAATIRGDFPDLQADLGDAYRLQAANDATPPPDAIAKAEGHYRQAIDSLPGHSRAHRGLAALHLEADRLEEALEHIEHALRTAPNDWETQRDAMAILLRLGREEEAFEHAKAAVRLNPTLPPPAILIQDAATAADDGAVQP